MHEMIDFTKPTRCIVHYAMNEGRGLPVYYQITIDTSEEKLSPSGEFIRFNYSNEAGEPINEIHGWVRISDLIIDEILEEIEVLEVSNG